MFCMKCHRTTHKTEQCIAQTMASGQPITSNNTSNRGTFTRGSTRGQRVSYPSTRGRGAINQLSANELTFSVEEVYDSPIWEGEELQEEYHDEIYEDQSYINQIADLHEIASESAHENDSYTNDDFWTYSDQTYTPDTYQEDHEGHTSDMNDVSSDFNTLQVEGHINVLRVIPDSVGNILQALTNFLATFWTIQCLQE